MRVCATRNWGWCHSIGGPQGSIGTSRYALLVPFYGNRELEICYHSLVKSRVEEYAVDGQVCLYAREVASISMVILDHNMNTAVVRSLSSRGENVHLKHTQPRRRAEFSP